MNDAPVPAVKIEKPVVAVKVKKVSKPKPMAKKKAATRKPRAKKVAKRRPFPYARVAKMWGQKKTLETIARSIGRYEAKADDPLHTLRVFIWRMHKGYRNGNGKLVRLPHRVKKSSLAASRKAGRKAAA